MAAIIATAAPLPTATPAVSGISIMVSPSSLRMRRWRALPSWMISLIFSTRLPPVVSICSTTISPPSIAADAALLAALFAELAAFFAEPAAVLAISWASPIMDLALSTIFSPVVVDFDLLVVRVFVPVVDFVPLPEDFFDDERVVVFLVPLLDEERLPDDLPLPLDERL